MQKSFERVRKWLENVVTSGAGDTQKLLVGNKVDLPDITVPTTEGKHLSTELGMAFVRCLGRAHAILFGRPAGLHPS